MAGDPAELAYGHALAMLGDPEAGADVAITALRRAGRARRLVLAHARQQAVARAADYDPVDIANLRLVMLDVAALAATLASTRSAEERAALDLRVRVGGDLAALGEALGMRPNDANDRTTAIAADWEQELDPAVLAFSGPGDCEGLAAILDDASSETVADLLAIAPTVAAHAQDCVACSDRMRAMNSVRSFFSAGTAEVPPPVRDASRVSRRLRPSAAPAPLYGRAMGSRIRWRDAVTFRRVAVVAGLLVAFVAIGIAIRPDDDSTSVATLTAARAADVTLTPPAQTDSVNASIELRNATDRRTTYRAATSVDWLRVTPARGTLGPRAAQILTITALDSAPEGDNRATVTVTTVSGATTTRELVWHIDHAPDLAASANGCSVSVNVVEEGDLTSLVLHWLDTIEHQLDITHRPDGYEAMLEPEGHPITYWVTATDARGNVARTADQTIPADAC